MVQGDSIFFTSEAGNAVLSLPIAGPSIAGYWHELAASREEMNNLLHQFLDPTRWLALAAVSTPPIGLLAFQFCALVWTPCMPSMVCWEYGTTVDMVFGRTMFPACPCWVICPSAQSRPSRAGRCSRARCSPPGICSRRSAWRCPG